MDTASAVAGSRLYGELPLYAETRFRELSGMLQPVVDLTDGYGVLICGVTSILGSSAPASVQDTVVRDLLADVFDFLYEWRRPLLEGRLHVAYPLARRAYESLSLMSLCQQDAQVAARWHSGAQIGNAEVRKQLSRQPMSEPEEMMRSLYRFFSIAAHPNRDLVQQRFLGEGNQFVLGSIGRPTLSFVVDQCIHLVEMWFWFGALVSYSYRDIIAPADPAFGRHYFAVADQAEGVKQWLVESFNRVLEHEQAQWQERRAKPEQP